MTKEFSMKRETMNLMIKTWMKKATRILSLKAGKITAISSSETTQQRRTLEKVRRKNKSFPV